MEALAPGRLPEAGQTARGQALTDVQRSGNDGGERHVPRRVEVDDQPVGMGEVIGAGAPGVQLQDADLDQAHQARQILDHRHAPPSHPPPAR